MDIIVVGKIYLFSPKSNAKYENGSFPVRQFTISLPTKSSGLPDPIDEQNA